MAESVTVASYRVGERGGHRAHRHGGAAMLIDCNQCTMQDTSACDECVMSFLLHDPTLPLVVAEECAGALEALAGGGLVPELRLVPKSAAG